jgi:hypothetical protein
MTGRERAKMRVDKVLEALNFDMTTGEFICPNCKASAGVYTFGAVVFNVKLFFTGEINLVKEKLEPELEKAKMKIRPSGKQFYCANCKKKVTRALSIYKHLADKKEGKNGN